MATIFGSIFRPRTMLTERDRHTGHYIIGEPQVGKSRLLESLIRQDIEAGRGVSVVDVAGGLYQRLTAWLATQPHVWPRLVLIDPARADYVVRINPLATLEGMAGHRASEFFRSIMTELWELDADDTPRMVWAMANAFQALSVLGLTLADLRDFLLSKPFRESQLVRLPAEMAHVRQYFATEFGRAQGGAHAFSLPMLSRIGPLLFDMDIRLMHSGRDSLDFRRVLDDGLIVMVNLPKGSLTPETSKLVAAFVVARYQQAAISRANTWIDDASVRRPHYLYLDEFGNYTTSNITNILAESRQFNLRLIMAHQTLSQLSPDLRSGVLATSGVVTSMRVGYEDARVLAPIIFPRDDFFVHRDVQYQTLGRDVATSVMARWQTRPYGWDGLAQVLANQPNRSFWSRRKGPFDPVNLQTHDVPDFVVTSKLEEQMARMREESGQRCGIRREDALKELQAQEEQRAAMRTAAKAKDDSKPKRPRGRPRKSAPSAK
jgi:hypothetical protein